MQKKTASSFAPCHETDLYLLSPGENLNTSERSWPVGQAKQSGHSYRWTRSRNATQLSGDWLVSDFLSLCVNCLSFSLACEVVYGSVRIWAKPLLIISVVRKRKSEDHLLFLLWADMCEFVDHPWNHLVLICFLACVFAWVLRWAYLRLSHTLGTYVFFFFFYFFYSLRFTVLPFHTDLIWTMWLWLKIMSITNLATFMSSNVILGLIYGCN